MNHCGKMLTPSEAIDRCKSNVPCAVLEIRYSLEDCHSERSEESAVSVPKIRALEWKQQIPHGLKAVRNDNSGDRSAKDIIYAGINKARIIRGFGRHG